jgi:dienelactone hydrolase
MAALSSCARFGTPSSCGDDSGFSRPFLTEVASHGYLVIALGAMKSGPGGEGVMRDATSPEGAPTSTRDLLTALDWVSGLPASRDCWKEYVDIANIAAAGYSCGSSLAVDLARDRRLRTAIALNGGVFRNRLPGITISMSDLSQMHTPLLYVLGGPTDVAYHSAMTNLAHLDHVPSSSSVAKSDTVAHIGHPMAAPSLKSRWLGSTGNSKAARRCATYSLAIPADCAQIPTGW